MKAKSPRRILIVSLDNLGDLAFAGALVPPLRAAHPEAELGVWSKEYAAPLAPFLPGVALFHAGDPFWDKSPGRGRGTVAGFARGLSEVRRAGYDAALLPNTRWRVALAARAAGIPRRVGFAQKRSARWLTDALPAERDDRAVVGEWARLLAPLGADPARAELRLEVPASLTGARDALRARLGAGPLAAIHPFAGDARRCASPAFWAELLRRLRANGTVRAVVVGAPEESRAFAAALSGAAGLPELVLAADLGGGSLTESLLAVSLSALFVGHDSGPLHCASGLGVPCLGLYLPGDWPRAMPQGRSPWRALRAETPAGADPAAAAALAAELGRTHIK